MSRNIVGVWTIRVIACTMCGEACSTVMMYEKPYAAAMTRKMVPVVRRVLTRAPCPGP